MPKKTVLYIALFLSTLLTSAQVPYLLPTGETEPLELTLFNVIVYMVLPVLIFIIYFWYRKSKRQKKNGGTESSDT